MDSTLLAQQPAVASVPVGPPSQTTSSNWKFDFAFSETAPKVASSASANAAFKTCRCDVTRTLSLTCHGQAVHIIEHRNWKPTTCGRQATSTITTGLSPQMPPPYLKAEYPRLVRRCS